MVDFKGVGGTLNLLGEFCYIKAGSDRPAKFRSRSSQELLAILAVRRGEAVSRAWIEEILWPGSDGDRQSQNLRKAIADLRDALGIEPQDDSVIKVTRDSLTLQAGAIDIDLWQPTVPLERAGDLLPWVTNIWVVPHRREFEDRTIREIAKQVAESHTKEQLQELKRKCLTLIRLLPTRQEPREALILLCCRLGERAEAVQHFDDLAEMLDVEFGELPSPSSVKALNTDPDYHELDQNHPAFSTYAIGRQLEAQLVLNLLSAQPHHVVTVFGPAGIGKTALAQAVLAILKSSIRTYFVPLGELQGIDELHPRLCHLMGLRTSDTNIERLLAHLTSEPTLLVFDNAEHLLPDLLYYIKEIQSAGIRMLVTSRHRLDLPNEELIPLDGVKSTSLDGEAPASLFLRYLRESLPEYQPSTVEMGHLYEIVATLDGHPLSVKIAAKFAESLSIPDILNLVRTCSEGGFTWNDGFGDIVGSAYESLEEDQKALFRAASVFIGAFSESELRAAASVEECSAGVERLTSVALLNQLSDGRFSMLFPLKDFAKSITTKDEYSSIYERLGFYYERETCTLRVKSNQSEYRATVAEFRKIERNILTVVQRLGAIRSYFHITSRIAFHSFIFLLSSPLQTQWTEAIQSMIRDEDDTEHLGLFYYVSGSLHIAFGDISEAIKQTEKSAIIFENGHRVDAIGARLTAISAKFMRGTDALEAAQISIPILESLNNELRHLTENGKYWGREQTLARGCSFLGICMRNKARPLEAIPLYQECFKISEAMSNLRFMATSAQALADVYLDAGEHKFASSWFKTAIDYYDRGDSPHMLSQLYESQGFLHCLDSNIPAALQCVIRLQELEVDLKRHSLPQEFSVLAAILLRIDTVRAKECYRSYRDFLLPGSVLGKFIWNYFPAEWHEYEPKEQSVILAKVKSRNYYRFVQEHLRLSQEALKG